GRGGDEVEAVNGERHLCAELKCCNCGYAAGHLIGPARKPLVRGYIHFAGAPDREWIRADPGRHLSCPRCGGRLLLDDVDYSATRREAARRWLQQQRLSRPSQAGTAA